MRELESSLNLCVRPTFTKSYKRIGAKGGLNETTEPFYLRIRLSCAEVRRDHRPGWPDPRTTTTEHRYWTPQRTASCFANVVVVVVIAVLVVVVVSVGVLTVKKAKRIANTMHYKSQGVQLGNSHFFPV